MVTGSLSRG